MVMTLKVLIWKSTQWLNTHCIQIFCYCEVQYCADSKQNFDLVLFTIFDNNWSADFFSFTVSRSRVSKEVIFLNLSFYSDFDFRISNRHRNPISVPDFNINVEISKLFFH
jgi:hypothetical protein